MTSSRASMTRSRICCWRDAAAYRWAALKTWLNGRRAAIGLTVPLADAADSLRWRGPRPGRSRDLACAATTWSRSPPRCRGRPVWRRSERGFPNRMFDVGIAEQHAVTSAAGLALGGMHPVVAIYSTFLNRAFDQVLMDVALLKLPVTFVLDRAGITGPDGASHNGVWDLSLLGMVPGMRVAAPRDAASLREQLGEALGGR